MTLISQSNWDVNYFIAPDTDLRLGNCSYNGTTVIHAASVPFIYVSYAADFAFTDLGPEPQRDRGGPGHLRRLRHQGRLRPLWRSYLYEHIWRFYEDGQFASSILIHGPGVENQGQHSYHVPFRYDLDGFGDSLQQWFEGIGGWTDVPEEGRLVAGPLAPPFLYHWQQVDIGSGKRAMVRARDGDRGEIWALQYSASTGDRSGTHGRAAGRPASPGRQRVTGSGSDSPHVGGLGALRALHDVELDPHPLLQRAVPGVRDGAVVHEEVRAVPVRVDEAVALFSVEPLDRSLSHRRVPPSVAWRFVGHPTDRASAARPRRLQDADQP
jgi:hypothetical protein